MCVLEVYAIGKNDARAVLETKQSSADRYEFVLDLERHGKARLDTLSALATKSGQRAVVEACDEVRYPTEFAPGRTRDEFPTSTAFETRNAGDMLEIEPALGPDGLSCSVNIVPQRVSLAGFRDIPGMADDPPVGQPIFVTQKLTTSANMAVDQVRLLGTLSPPAGKARSSAQSPELWLAFLHVHRVFAAADPREGKPAPRSGSTIDMEFSFYSLERDAARDLLASFRKLDTPWERLQELLRANKARFEDFASVKTVSGQRCVTEGINEIRYGTEYSLPGVRRTHETRTRKLAPPEAGKDGNKQAQPAAADQETTTVETEAPTSEPVPGTSTAFETRNAGLTLEIEPALGPDSATVDLNAAVKIVTDLGSLETTGAAAHSIAQPLFESRAVTTSLTTLIGSHALVGTLSMPGADGVNGRMNDGRTWLVFIRVVPGDR